MLELDFLFPPAIKWTVGQDSDRVQDSNFSQAARCGLGPHGHRKA